MNLANKITISRILLIPVIMASLLSPVSLTFMGLNYRWGSVAAGAIFVLAALTDTLDGYLARSRGEITVLGQILDPLADKLLISSALISLVALGSLSPWVAVIIIGREFAVTGLRMAAAVRQVVIPAGGLGKTKTVFQILAVVYLIILPPLGLAGTLIKWTLLVAAVVLTIVSGLQYFAKSYGLVFEDQREPAK